jgi:hypothetical protein
LKPFKVFPPIFAFPAVATDSMLGKPR